MESMRDIDRIILDKLTQIDIKLDKQNDAVQNQRNDLTEFKAEYKTKSKIGASIFGLLGGLITSFLHKHFGG